MRYTRSYSGSNGVFITTYKLYHPVKGTQVLTITATNHKDEQKIVVKLNDTSGGRFSEINTEEITYEGTPEGVSLNCFGFYGTPGRLSRHRVPYDLWIQFASRKGEHVNVLDISGSHEGGDLEFFVLDKATQVKPVAGALKAHQINSSDIQGFIDGKALYGAVDTRMPDSDGLEMSGWRFKSKPVVAVVDEEPSTIRFKIKVSEEGDVETLTKVSGNVSLEQEKLCRNTLSDMVFVRKNAAGGGATGFYTFELHERDALAKTPILDSEEANNDIPADDKVYSFVEQMPQLPGDGGSEAISQAIQNATKYPVLALRNHVEGRIFVSFTVEPQGNVSNVQVVKGLGSGLDEEVVQAVKALPIFIPGKENGRVVRVSYTLPVELSVHPKPVTVPSADVKPKTFRGGILGSLISSRTLLMLVTRPR